MRSALAALFALALVGAARADAPKPLTAVGANELRQQYDRQMKDFADAIEKVKDNPEAKEALEKARDEYKKGMEPKLKEAEKALPPNFEAPIPPQRFRPDQQVEELEKLQMELMRDQMNALRMLQGLQGMNRDALNGLQPGGRNVGRIGLRFEPMPAVLVEQLGLDKNVGVVLAEVQPGSVAEKAGLKPNDVLLQFGGKDVSADVPTVARQFAAAAEGDKLDLLVLRKGKKEKVDGLVVPGEAARRPAPAVVLRGIGQGVRVTVNNGAVSLSSTDGNGVEVAATGTMDAATGKFVPDRITIKDGDEKVEAASLEKVPEKYKARVEKLLGSVGGARRER